MPENQADSSVIYQKAKPKNQAREIITFEKVARKFERNNEPPVYALNNLSFSIKEHEIVSFVGPSGCGKTTVLRILSGLDQESEGDVKIDGQPVQIGMCGMVFQSYSSFPWLTVIENVSFGLKIQNKDNKEKKEIEDLALKYIDLVGLSGFENRYPKELSGGQKQRVAIARSLAVENEILLMDEPFGALDIKIRSEMQEFLLDIWRKLNRTIILVTHDIQEAIYLPNRIFVFSKPAQHPEGMNSQNQIKQIPINKKLVERNPQWKNSHEFENYEKQLKELQFQ
ncbi:MAG: ABC transporter ATP-binding protein [bacterium]